VSDPDATIRGYILSMDDGNGGAFADIFSGIFEPSTLNYLVTGLTTGKKYRFKVRAAGYNEEGPESTIASFYACTSPSGFASPVAIEQTEESILIQWKAPTDNGGCTLSSYAVFRDDGAEGEVTTEVNSVNDIAVRDNPSLDVVNITNFDSGGADVGKTFRVKVTAYNVGGREADSGVVALVLASIPDTPTVGPQNDATITSSNRIRVTYGVTSPPDNGGSPILSYALEIDDGKGGSFQKLIGSTSNSFLTAYTISTGIEKGLEYRLRYRVKNAIGWSGYSPISFILAANAPDAPPKPTFSSFDTSTLYLNIQPSKDNGGSPILFYHLYRYNSTSGDFDLIESLSPGSLIYSATAGTDGYAIGSTYRYKVVVQNGVDSSEASDEAYIAFGDVPPQPTAIDANDCTTTRSTIHVSWDPVSAPLSVTGYILNMDDGRLGEYSQVYVGTNRPDLTEYTVTGLTTGLSYKFTLQAINYNGRSLASSSTTLYACDVPAGLAAPKYVSSDKDALTITLSWDSPSDEGG
jgi:titin